MLLKVFLPNGFSQPSWYRILNNWPGLFSFALFSFFSPWCCLSGRQMNCYSYDSAFLICCFLPFLSVPSFSTMQNCISASWRGMFYYSVPSFSVIGCFQRQFHTAILKCERSFSSPCNSLYLHNLKGWPETLYLYFNVSMQWFPGRAEGGCELAVRSWFCAHHELQAACELSEAWALSFIHLFSSSWVFFKGSSRWVYLPEYKATGNIIFLLSLLFKSVSSFESGIPF